MKKLKSKRKIWLTGLALVVPLVGVIASACSVVGKQEKDSDKRKATAILGHAARNVNTRNQTQLAILVWPTINTLEKVNGQLPLTNRFPTALPTDTTAEVSAEIGPDMNSIVIKIALKKGREGTSYYSATGEIQNTRFEKTFTIYGYLEFQEFISKSMQDALKGWYQEFINKSIQDALKGYQEYNNKSIQDALKGYQEYNNKSIQDALKRLLYAYRYLYK